MPPKPRDRALREWRDRFTRLTTPTNSAVEQIVASNIRDFASSDLVAMAASGMLSLTGDPSREPLNPPACQGYQVTSLWATLEYHAGTGTIAVEVVRTFGDPVTIDHIAHRGASGAVRRIAIEPTELVSGCRLELTL